MEKGVALRFVHGPLYLEGEERLRQRTAPPGREAAGLISEGTSNDGFGPGSSKRSHSRPRPPEPTACRGLHGVSQRDVPGGDEKAVPWGPLDAVSAQEGELRGLRRKKGTSGMTT